VHTAAPAGGGGGGDGGGSGGGDGGGSGGGRDTLFGAVHRRLAAAGAYLRDHALGGVAAGGGREQDPAVRRSEALADVDRE